MAMRKGVGVHIYGDWDGTGVKRAQRDLSMFEKQSQGFSSSISKSWMGLGASLGGIFAASAIVDFFKDSAQAAMEDERSMASLAKTMENVGQGFRTTGIEELIGKMQLATGVADTDLRSAFQRLVTVTRDAAESQELLKLAMDVSAGTGKDLEAVSMALAKAASGQTTALQRLGVGLDAATLKSKDMGAITDALSDKFRGQAAVAANTYEGQMKRITAAAGEAQEAIGYALLNAINNTAKAITSTGGIQQALLGLGNYIASVITDVGYLTTALATASTYYKQAASDIGLPSKAMEILVGIITRLLLPGLAQAGLAVKNLGIIWNAMPEWMRTAAGALLGWSGATTVASASAKMLSVDANRLSLEHEHLARAATNAQPALAGMAGDMDDLADSSANAAEQVLKTVLAINALSLSREHNARAEMAGKGPSLELLRLLIPMREAMNNAARASGGAASGMDKLTKAQEDAKQAAQDLAQNVDSLTTSLTGLLQEISPAVVDMTKVTFEGINAQVEKFKSTLAEARQYAQGIVDGFMGQLSLGAALDAAKETGSSIVEAFVKQGEKVVEFGNKMRRLLDAGLSRAAFDEIMGLGYQRGSDVADALIQGNLDENVRSVNKVYESVKTMAEQIAEAAASAFYQAGLEMTYNLIRAMVEVLGIGGPGRKRLLNIMDDLSAAMRRDVIFTVRTVSEGGAAAPVSAELATAMASYTGPTFTAPVDFSEFGSGLRLFADGGIATSATLGVFGEAGPEALIPLDRMDSMGGNTYQITVNAGVGDPRAIGKSVVEAITLFERSSGPVFARA